ncbi:helix-turn-helix domain-containing protein [uncultured Flavobacterium sp.]|uniref:LexA family transcriptional regulator n=1 Tax=uncultured Flavobacterium sp. TaxID=165435 RepID=UPI0025E66F54|nr:helix-turn-helix domain-containing protein [uncultured Flavobacterium sp.]
MQENKSQNAINVIDRLKKALKIKTDIELSEFLNIKPNTISTWKKRDSVDFDSIISICELYELDLNEIFLNKKKASNYTADTPLVSREVQFQYVRENDIASFLEILPKYSFPFVNSEETRAFQVISNNMFPFIEENSYVVCEKIEQSKVENLSMVVVISKQKGLFLNRISKSETEEDAFILSSENDFFNEVILKVSEISELWLIRGVLSYDINCENRFKFINSGVKIINKFLDKQKHQ